MSEDWPMLTNISSVPREATHIVTGYDAFGRVLVQTWHTSTGSMQIEVSAWRSRLRKGTAAMVEVMHLNETPKRVEVIR